MNQGLVTAHQMLEEKDIERRKFVLEHLVALKSEIYDNTVGEILKRDFKSAELGLAVLLEIDRNRTYANALSLLKDKNQLK